MIQGLLHNTTIPALSESIHFAQARHELLASNVANLDTPGYLAQDLSVEDFQSMLAEAIERRTASGSASLSGDSTAAAGDPLAAVRQATDTVLRHDGVNVGMEQQVLEISKNQFLHNLAITVMGSQFRLLQTMISEHL
ncbi:MAG: flagellar basal body rod protein FlgB [Pirellulaceae bacterium]